MYINERTNLEKLKKNLKMWKKICRRPTKYIYVNESSHSEGCTEIYVRNVKYGA